jgi:hypothetical protein
LPISTSSLSSLRGGSASVTCSEELPSATDSPSSPVEKKSHPIKNKIKDKNMIYDFFFSIKILNSGRYKFLIAFEDNDNF